MYVLTPPARALQGADGPVDAGPIIKIGLLAAAALWVYSKTRKAGAR